MNDAATECCNRIVNELARDPDWFWPTTITAVVTVLTAAAGWLVAHWLQLRAQRDHFRWQIRNESAIRVGNALGIAIDALVRKHARILALGIGLGVTDGWKKQAPAEAAMRDVWLATGSALTALEHHQAVFPRVQPLLPELVGFVRDVQVRVGDALATLTSLPLHESDLKDVRSRLDEAACGSAVLIDLAGVLSDVHRFLQNDTLGAIFDSVVPMRVPADGYPRVVSDAQGNLHLDTGLASAKRPDPESSR